MENRDGFQLRLGAGIARLRRFQRAFIISAGDEDFVDDAALQVPAMLDAMERCETASHTSCPTPQAWLEEFEQADRCIAITISSRLSGSMNSAQIARELALERAPEKRIAVLDSRSTGPEIALCVEAMQGWIAQGMDFEGVVRAAGRFLQKTHIAFALSSFDNLIKNGRMSRAVGFLAHKLGMWGIGAGSDEGEIAVRGKRAGHGARSACSSRKCRRKGFAAAGWPSTTAATPISRKSCVRKFWSTGKTRA